MSGVGTSRRDPTTAPEVHRLAGLLHTPGRFGESTSPGSGDEARAASERTKAERVIALVLEHGDDEDRAEAEALLEQLGDSPAR